MPASRACNSPKVWPEIFPQVNVCAQTLAWVGCGKGVVPLPMRHLVFHVTSLLRGRAFATMLRANGRPNTRAQGRTPYV